MGKSAERFLEKILSKRNITLSREQEHRIREGRLRPLRELCYDGKISLEEFDEYHERLTYDFKFAGGVRRFLNNIFFQPLFQPLRDYLIEKKHQRYLKEP